MQFWKNEIASSEDLALAVMPLLDGVELLVQLAMQIPSHSPSNGASPASSALIRQRCFPPESSSIPLPATESDCGTTLR